LLSATAPHDRVAGAAIPKLAASVAFAFVIDFAKVPAFMRLVFA
jgi:hypothetical protein